MGFHIQMRNKVSYIKNLMEITIDILMVALFAHGYNTRPQRLQNEKKNPAETTKSLFHSETVICTERSNFRFCCKDPNRNLPRYWTRKRIIISKKVKFWTVIKNNWFKCLKYISNFKSINCFNVWEREASVVSGTILRRKNSSLSVAKEFSKC